MHETNRFINQAKIILGEPVNCQNVCKYDEHEYNRRLLATSNALEVAYNAGRYNAKQSAARMVRDCTERDGSLEKLAQAIEVEA